MDCMDSFKSDNFLIAGGITSIPPKKPCNCDDCRVLYDIKVFCVQSFQSMYITAVLLCVTWGKNPRLQAKPLGQPAGIEVNRGEY